MRMPRAWQGVRMAGPGVAEPAPCPYTAPVQQAAVQTLHWGNHTAACSDKRKPDPSRLLC